MMNRFFKPVATQALSVAPKHPAGPSGLLAFLGVAVANATLQYTIEHQSEKTTTQPSTSPHKP